MIIKSIFDKKPIAIIDNTGIVFRDYGFLKWEEIKSLSIIEIKGIRFLSITVKNPEHLASQLNKIKRIYSK